MHFDLLELGETALRLGVALLLGSAIGFERQWNQKMAGLRTNALVALGAAGFVTFSGLVGAGDPTRVAAQVVTGIGFLGAGVILREGVNAARLERFHELARIFNGHRRKFLAGFAEEVSDVQLTGGAALNTNGRAIEISPLGDAQILAHQQALSIIEDHWTKVETKLERAGDGLGDARE